MMKTLIAATALSLVAGAAFAGEGQGNPFPYTAPPLSVSTLNFHQGPGSAQNPFPYNASGYVHTTAPVMPTTGSNGVVQTANSLPPGFEDGAPSQANLNQNAPTPTRLAQPVVPTSTPRG